MVPLPASTWLNLHPDDQILPFPPQRRFFTPPCYRPADESWDKGERTNAPIERLGGEMDFAFEGGFRCYALGGGKGRQRRRGKSEEGLCIR
jgi:hypothetical protein